MGPVASFIIDDKLMEWGEAKGYFPRDQAKPFVEALGEEVPSELKRKEFIKVLVGLFPREQ
jgi:hypothetical protein